MPWVLRGLRNGILTTAYPKRPDPYGSGFRAAPLVAAGGAVAAAVRKICPTGAISVDAGSVHLDRGRCILCGACVRRYPDTFRWAWGSETSALHRRALVVPADLEETEAELARTRAALATRVRRLRRSVHIRHVDAGSDGAEEWEIQALTNPTYDIHRLGIFLTASPRHADILLVTGAGARGMLGPLRRTQVAMPNPLLVIAVGTDAISGGLVAGGYATVGGVAGELDVDVFVPGSPPPPFAILHGILLALDRLPVTPASAQ
ncbi:MAG: NADH-quinone oxidoreductase subunit B family protein [Mycobacteriales bacterium]